MVVKEFRIYHFEASYSKNCFTVQNVFVLFVCVWRESCKETEKRFSLAFLSNFGFLQFLPSISDGIKFLIDKRKIWQKCNCLGELRKSGKEEWFDVNKFSNNRHWFSDSSIKPNDRRFLCFTIWMLFNKVSWRTVKIDRLI